MALSVYGTDVPKLSVDWLLLDPCLVHENDNARVRARTIYLYSLPHVQYSLQAIPGLLLDLESNGNLSAFFVLCYEHSRSVDLQLLRHSQRSTSTVISVLLLVLVSHPRTKYENIRTYTTYLSNYIHTSLIAEQPLSRASLRLSPHYRGALSKYCLGRICYAQSRDGHSRYHDTLIWLSTRPRTTRVG